VVVLADAAFDAAWNESVGLAGAAGLAVVGAGAGAAGAAGALASLGLVAGTSGREGVRNRNFRGSVAMGRQGEGRPNGEKQLLGGLSP
jgi:hypothetical protein